MGFNQFQFADPDTSMAAELMVWVSQPHRGMAQFVSFLLFLVLCLKAEGGFFVTDFSTRSGFTLTGSGKLANGSTWKPVITGNALILTTNSASSGQGATMVINDLDGGRPIESFLATFDLQFGPGSIPPGDGMSFNFGPD